ncbi:MAG TPA: DUF4931 domain-containing protein [Candidatus Nealsonbacteria bacterium]|uniref:Uncharacterized protein n=1 Tax=marine sediment metagenome TaxID=412755 RepID=A0A0F9VSN0_9ZZZZ|nr:DUF4931 domain-containing protein [Candidatus Nealsonbacteria bacterium]HEB46341.1 DUF4931 domain-containing protein [Candidatus Nealsonbacteria bacterium]
MKKKRKLKKSRFPSELRLDLVSRDWVVIATGRARRLETFKQERRKKETIPKSRCPFCQIHTQEIPTVIFSNSRKVFPPNEKLENLAPLGIRKFLTGWTTISIPNKYPAFIPSPEFDEKIEGNIYQTMNAVGFHEVVITRDHEKQLAQFSISQVKETIDVYQQRYLELMKEKFVSYVSIFHNHGIEAGATIVHPHSQIVTIPLIDVDLKRSLVNSKKYFKVHKKCIYCQMVQWEIKIKKRIIFENEDFLVICPFASKSAFEVIISPKKHHSYFERITEKEKQQLAEAFKIALNKLYKALNDPAYNFYLHTAPCDGKNYDYYHWHWTILPKTSTWAGFEMGAKIEISTIEPERAAEYLRRQR